jgi:Thioredoxin like C-terminal domain
VLRDMTSATSPDEERGAGDNPDPRGCVTVRAENEKHPVDGGDYGAPEIVQRLASCTRRCRWAGLGSSGPGEAHGTDVDRDGNGTLAQQRVYQLIRQPGPITDRTFEVTFPDPGAQAYSFTFG